MPSYTASLRLVQPSTGEYSGSWGTQVNNGITALVDTSIAGTASIVMTAADYTLSTANGATDEARAMVLNVTGTPGAARNIIVPAVSKIYVVFNNTTGGFAQTVKTSAGSGISVPNGVTAFVRCDGTNVVTALNYFASLSLGAALPVASGGTGSTSTTYCSLTTNVTGTLPVANGGTGITSFGTGVATWLGTPSSANLAAAVTDETGSGALVFGTSPTLTDPVVTSLNTGQLAGMRNKIINGAMGIDQRNAGAAQTITAAAALAYTVDRWYAYCTGANVTGQQVGGTAPNQFNYRFTGAASVTKIGFAQRIEAVNSQDLAGTTATLSVDLANSLLTTVTWTVWRANSNDAFGTLASPTRTQIATGTFTVTSTLTRYSTQISIPSAATTGLEIEFSVAAQTSGTWTIGRAQLENGSAATPFENRLIGAELEFCQRYYQVFNGFNIEGYASAGNTRAVSVPMPFPVQMRATPTRTVITAGTLTNVRASSTAYAGLGIEDLTSTYASASVEAAAAGLASTINQTESFSAEL